MHGRCRLTTRIQLQVVCEHRAQEDCICIDIDSVAIVALTAGTSVLLGWHEQRSSNAEGHVTSLRFETTAAEIIDMRFVVLIKQYTFEATLTSQSLFTPLRSSLASRCTARRPTQQTRSSTKWFSILETPPISFAAFPVELRQADGTSPNELRRKFVVRL
jgi:hypothetical protein